MKRVDRMVYRAPYPDAPWHLPHLQYEDRAACGPRLLISSDPDVEKREGEPTCHHCRRYAGLAPLGEPATS